MSDGYAMTEKEISLYLTIITLYEQQSTCTITKYTQWNIVL